jgi:tetratricopeptide (TPR) repeat protein
LLCHLVDLTFNRWGGPVQSQKHNSQRALAHFRAAVKAHPGEACPWYLLAEALAAEGKPKGGPDYTEEIHAAAIAVKLDPKLVVARDLLSAAYYSAGQKQEAMEQSRAALAVNAEDHPLLPPLRTKGPWRSPECYQLAVIGAGHSSLLFLTSAQLHEQEKERMPCQRERSIAAHSSRA